MLKVESKIVTIHRSAEDIYALLSKFENFLPFLPQEQIHDLQIEEDHCSFTVEGQKMELVILEKIPFHTIKYGSGENSPFKFLFWTQLKEIEPFHTKIKLTIHLDVPLMVQPFIKGKLEKALNSMADRFSAM